MTQVADDRRKRFIGDRVGQRCVLALQRHAYGQRFLRYVDLRAAIFIEDDGRAHVVVRAHGAEHVGGGDFRPEDDRDVAFDGREARRCQERRDRALRQRLDIDAGRNHVVVDVVRAQQARVDDADRCDVNAVHVQRGRLAG